MNDYQKEQIEALSLVREGFSRLKPHEADILHERTRPYLDFRHEVDAFLSAHFTRHCTRSCFESRMSACCTKDGIITFWADWCVNTLVSGPAQMADLNLALTNPGDACKCTYLGPEGCRWRLRPLMCAMFLCDQVQTTVFSADHAARCRWDELQKRANDFRWPDKPVLFDWMETFFMARGIRSTLMYLNTSPGLLRVKRKAGL